jgi:hypothetical protein
MSPVFEWPRFPSLMAASVDRAARLVLGRPKPRTCVNDLLTSDDAPAAAHHAFSARVSASF